MVREDRKSKGGIGGEGRWLVRDLVVFDDNEMLCTIV